MSQAMQTVYTIKPATTNLAARTGFVVFVRGPLRVHDKALENLWARLRAGLFRNRFAYYRAASKVAWTQLPEPAIGEKFVDLFGMLGPLRGFWGLELAERVDDSGTASQGAWVQLGDLAPVRNMVRASFIRVLFPDDTAVQIVAALGEWCINYLPLWWGSAGLVFHHESGSPFTAHARMAAMAKRYWGVQILDMGALQWDALRGMPSVNWITIVGSEFARAREMSIDAITAAAAALSTAGVSHRGGPYGVAIAAGPRPLFGDINLGEDVDAYASVANIIRPLLLTEHTPLDGPFARPDVLRAWLGRFGAPEAWLVRGIGS